MDNSKTDARTAPEGGVTCTQEEPEQEQLEKLCTYAEKHDIPLRNSVWLAEVDPLACLLAGVEDYHNEHI